MTLSRLSYWLSAAYVVGELLGYRRGKRDGRTLGYIEGVRDMARARVDRPPPPPPSDGRPRPRAPRREIYRRAVGGFKS